MIEVDLRARVVPDDHRVFMVRPGSGYKLYSLFAESKAIYLDMVGLELERGKLLEEQDRLTAQLHRSRKLRNYLKNSEYVEAPSRELADYEDYKDARSVAQLHRIVRGFLEEARRGDLVVVPPLNFSGDTLIGELVSEGTDFFTAPNPLYRQEEMIYGRRVNWLARIKKGKLSPYLLDLISKPNAFVTVRKSERAELYRAAYGSYILAGESRARFDVSDPEFTPQDDLYIQAFFNFVAANSRNLEMGKPLVGIKEAAFDAEETHRLELQSNVNSPGYLNLLSSLMTPLVASALLQLAITVGPAAAQPEFLDTLTIGNTLDPDGGCTAVVHKEVVDHLRLLGIDDKWEQACLYIRRAEQATGIKSQVSITLDSEDGTAE